METKMRCNEYGKITQSLNRTMQYGNYLNYAVSDYKRKQFKSYYVVWKPEK